MDPLLAQGFSNLTKALIGDPETDYQVARTGYQNEQTNRLKTLLPFEQQSIEAQIAQRNAAANASNSQAGLYGSQTTEQDLLNSQLQNLTTALTTLSSSPEVQAQVSAATGIDFSNAANVDAFGSALVTAMLGGTGNVDQRSSAFTNMANQANTNTAFNQIMDSSATPDQIRQAFIANGGDPGKYFDAGAARTEINYDYNAALDKNAKDLQGTQYTADRNLEGTQYKADQDLDGTRITAKSTEAYQNFKSNLQFGEGGQGDRDKAQDVVQAQWELNNKPLEFTVTPGQQIVLSPAAGERLGLEPNDEGLYVLDGGPKPGSIVVKVGEEDVYLTEADATALGIEKNDAGVYMIPGRANPTGSSGSKSPTSRTIQATQNLTEEMYADLTGFLKERIPASLGDLPNNVQVGIETFIIRQVDAFIGQNPNTPYMDAYNRVGAPIASGGVVELGNNDLRRSNIKVPRFFDEKWKSAAAKVGEPVTNGDDPYTRDQLVEAITKNATSLGYTPSDISKILESY
jgi:hypothetical protein